MSQLFVSYSRKDAQFVSRLVADLEAAGWDVFYDRKLIPSENYDERLPEELARAKFLLVVLSPDSLMSKNVLRELRQGLMLESEQRTTVIPVLIQPCDADKLRTIIGTKIYADFTMDYQSGFTELEKALSKSRNTDGGNETNEEIRGRKFMPVTKEQGIVVAVITAVAGLIGAYWQFVYKPAPPPPQNKAQYTARVMDAKTQQVIKGARVSIDIQGPPQVLYSDSAGVVNIELPATANSVHIVVEAEGYERFDRYISLSSTGVEEIRLTAVAPKESSTTSPQPTPRQSRRSAGGTQGQANRIDRILSSSSSNRSN